MSLYPDLVLSDGASGYWRLGDAVGSGLAIDRVAVHNGTANSGVTFGQIGALRDGNTAALFDGLSGFISTPSFGTAPSTFTVEGWFQSSSVTNNARILSNAFGTAGINIVMQSPGGSLLLILSDGSSTVTPNSVGSGLLDNKWHCVAVTRTAPTTGVLYIDGAVDSALNGLPSGTIPSNGLTFGRPPAAVNWFSGNIDEVAVYPTALSTAQIAAHYALRTATQSYVVGVAMPSTRISPLPNRNKSNQTYGWWASPNKRKY